MNEIRGGGRDVSKSRGGENGTAMKQANGGGVGG